MQKKIENKNQKITSSTQVIFIYAAAFWLLGYSIALIIFLWGVNFYPSTVNYQPSDSFLGLVFRNFKDTLFYIYSPLYIIPLLMASYLGIRWRSKKKDAISLVIFTSPICLSFFLSFVYFTLLSIFSVHSADWLWANGYRGEVILFLVAPLIQLISCLLLPIILNRKKERMASVPLLIGLVFLLITTFYISFSAKTAAQTPPLLEELILEAVEAKDISFCEKIVKEGKKRKFGAWRDFYGSCTNQLAQIAIDANDVKLCEKVIKTIGYGIHKWENGPEEKLKCFGLIAAATNNPILCIEVGSCLDTSSDIPPTNGRLKCFEEFFLNNNNPAICEEIKEGPTYIAKKNDKSMYGYLYKDICLYAAAFHFNNPNLCGKLMNEEDEKLCYDNVSIKK